MVLRTFLALSLVSSSVFATQPPCSDIISKTLTVPSGPKLEAEEVSVDLENNLKKTCEKTCTPAGLSKAIYQSLEKGFKKAGRFTKKNRGYAVIVSTMVGSAALSTYLTAHLPTHVQFLSQLVAQVSTIGIFVFGAPIWEPLSSRFRRFAFGMNDEPSESKKIETELEALWKTTQSTYSINAQMSRNVVNAFILTAQNSFYSAYGAMNEGNEEYAIDQIATTAVRMRKLFAELSPDDDSVAQAIGASFTKHVAQPSQLKERARAQIGKLDPEANHSPANAYYNLLIDTWLTN